MPPDAVPLSRLCPTWRGARGAKQFAALERGIARERERFRGKPLVLVQLIDGTDYDGLKTDLALVEGRVDEASALAHARQQADATLQRLLAETTATGAVRWTLVSPLETSEPREPIHPQVERVAFAVFKVRDHSGLCVERFVFMLLRVRAPEIIGPELFAALGWEFELQQFLIRCGTAERST